MIYEVVGASGHMYRVEKEVFDLIPSGQRRIICEEEGDVVNPDLGKLVASGLSVYRVVATNRGKNTVEYVGRLLP